MSFIGQNTIEIVGSYRQIGGIPSVSINQNPKVICQTKTIAALPPYTATGSGVDKRLTANANGNIGMIDGYAPVFGDRILVDQFGSASNVDNGVYSVLSTGNVSTPWILIRATDSDESYEIVSGFVVFISLGATTAGNSYMVLTPNPITIDVTPITFTLVTSAAGAVPTWAFVLGNGNVSGGTNAVMTTGDAITGENLALGGALTLRGGNSSGAASAGGAVTLTGGSAGAGGVGGGISLTSAAGNGAAAGGAIAITTGDGGAVSGNSGNITLASGNVTSGISGSFSFTAGISNGAGNPGGSVSLTGGLSVLDAGGAISLTGGSGLGTNGGAISIAGGPGLGVGNGGAVNLLSGNGVNNGGAFNITSGNSTGVGNGGNMTVTTGTGIGAGTSGGNFSVVAGPGVLTGGALSFTGGSSFNGGGISFTTGAGVGAGSAGGNFSITAGTGVLTGGNITLTPGTSAGTNGVIRFVGAANMPSTAVPGTTQLFKVTGTTAAPTAAASGGQLAYDEATGYLYYRDGITLLWRILGVSNAPTSESYSVAGGANRNPINTFATSFVTTTGAGTATGTLANGTVVGQIKNIVMSAGHTSNYALTIAASVLDAAGVLFGTITYTTGGQGSSLIWDGTNWVILNTGGVLS